MKATVELLKTHQVVNKVLEGFNVQSVRFPEVMRTLHRTLLAHAWLQDEILLPVLRDRMPSQTALLDEITDEHAELDRLLKALPDEPAAQTGELQAQALQIRTLIAQHFKKEAKTLYPLAEKSIDPQILNRLSQEMFKRQEKIRDVVAK
jgi:hemerythrin-like domain-containing protein